MAPIVWRTFTLTLCIQKVKYPDTHRPEGRYRGVCLPEGRFYRTCRLDGICFCIIRPNTNFALPISVKYAYAWAVLVCSGMCADTCRPE